jgi:deoxyribodipyrimidine photo-lyase
MIPEGRIRVLNGAPERRRAGHVLYWMTAFRRPRWNFALQRAAERARERGLPLIVFEGLRRDYPWASKRFDDFVLGGMRDNAAAFAKTRAVHLPYHEPEAGAGKGLLAALARRAALVVADDYPCAFLPRMLAAAAKGLDVRLEAVDSNGLLPLAATEKVFPTAYAFRRFLQRSLPAHLAEPPEEDPLAAGGLPAGEVPSELRKRWPAAALEGPAPRLAARAMGRLDRILRGYADLRNHPDDDGTSGLSPLLHFGHVSSHEVLARIAARERWIPSRFPRRTDGSKEGAWGMGPSAEAFLDQLVTWRELGFNFCSKRPDYDRYESLPGWARATLEKHAGDRREPAYTRGQFEAAGTHDEVWNAAQRQLVREGRLHNYLRRLWGKKILEWSASPREALATMIELNNTYALDGRDPNSYSGIFWVLGRYDRPWGPERPVLGTVRYMSTESARRKLRLRAYLERYAESGPRSGAAASGVAGPLRSGPQAPRL